MKIIVIGGVAAGMSAASKVKRTLPTSQVVVYEKGEDLSYGACGLPYYVGDEIKDIKSLVIRNKAQFEKSGIEVFDLHEVLSVNEKDKKIKVKNLRTEEEFYDDYDKLIVATGASPIRPDWEGGNLDNIHVLSNLNDGLLIKTSVLKEEIRNVIIVGGGFIGVELAENINKLGKNVTLIEAQKQILTHLDIEMSEMLKTEMTKNGIKVKNNESVLRFYGSTKVEGVVTDHDKYEADLVILAIGVRPNTKMFSDAQISKLKNGALKVNNKMETSIPDIYAAGDCASVYHRLKDSNEEYIPLATNANKQGKLIGSIIGGRSGEFLGALGTSMIKVFQLEGAKTGLSEKEAIQMGVDYITKTIKSHNHASYYPNSQSITIKLVADKQTHQLLGVQIVGFSGSALRINTAAVAIHAKLSTDELGWIDFGYAPPFSATWDALQVACNVIS